MKLSLGLHCIPPLFKLVTRDSEKHGSCPWVDKTAFSTLFSRMALGQGSASGSTFGSSENGPITRRADICGSCQVPGRAFVWSLDGYLDKQDWPSTMVENVWN